MKTYLLAFCLIPLSLLPLSLLADAPRLPYTCDNDSLIEISFSADPDGRPNATLHFADDRVTLPQVPAASGALYRANEIRLHTQNDEAVLEDAKGNSRHCKRGSVAPAKVFTDAASSSFIDISGRIYFYSRTPLPADAVMIVKIQDATRAKARPRTLAEVDINLIDQPVPVLFQTTIDRDLVGKNARVVVTVRIEQHGKLLFISDKAAPALFKGKPVFVEMQLKSANN